MLSKVRAVACIVVGAASLVVPHAAVAACPGQGSPITPPPAVPPTEPTTPTEPTEPTATPEPAAPAPEAPPAEPAPAPAEPDAPPADAEARPADPETTPEAEATLEAEAEPVVVAAATASSTARDAGDDPVVIPPDEELCDGAGYEEEFPDVDLVTDPVAVAGVQDAPPAYDLPYSGSDGTIQLALAGLGLVLGGLVLHRRPNVTTDGADR